MTAGTMLLIWIGELITQYGIGNGISIIIFGGIVARLPSQVGQALIAAPTSCAIVIFVRPRRCSRSSPSSSSTRASGAFPSRSPSGSAATHGTAADHAHSAQGQLGGHDPADLRLVDPDLPGTVAGYFLARRERVGPLDRRGHLQHLQSARRAGCYWVLYFWLVVAFTFFYTLVIFQQQNIAENLQQQGGFIPGIRPGRPTAEYLYKVLMRITLVGALFLGIVAVLPFWCAQPRAPDADARRHGVADRGRRRAGHDAAARSAAA